MSVTNIVVEPLNNGSLVSVKRKTGVTHAAVNRTPGKNFTDGPDRVRDPFSVEIQALPDSSDQGIKDMVNPTAGYESVSTPVIGLHTTVSPIPATPGHL